MSIKAFKYGLKELEIVEKETWIHRKVINRLKIRRKTIVEYKIVEGRVPLGVMLMMPNHSI